MSKWDGKKKWMVVEIEKGGDYTTSVFYDSYDQAEKCAFESARFEESVVLIFESVAGFKPVISVEAVEFKK